MDEDHAIGDLLEDLLHQRLGYAPSRPPQSVYDLLREGAGQRGVSQARLLQSLLAGREPELAGALVDEVTVSHTSIFRHPEQFEPLRRQLPAFARRAGGPVLVWSAGCATGEEAYSVAMCAEEVGTPVRILGTDVSPAAIAIARAGSYPRRRASRLQTTRRLDNWVAPESLRRVVQFEVASIVGPRPDLGRGPFHIIFCRNVLIYFERAGVAGILNRLATHLRPGGRLVISPADTVLPLPDTLVTSSSVGWLRLRGDDTPLSARAPVVAPPPTLPRRPSTPPSPIEEAARRLSAGDPETAEAILTEVLNANPDHLAGWFLLGEVLVQRGERAQARSAFVRATQCSHHCTGEFDAETLTWAAARRIEALSTEPD